MQRDVPFQALQCCVEARSIGEAPDPLPILVIILVALWFYSRRHRIAGVAKVVSGNTIIVSGQTIRLYAMYGLFDGQPWIDRHGISFNGGERSKAALAHRIDGKPVVCWIQPRGGSARGAKVCKVYHDDKDVARWMVGEGHALADIEPLRRKVYRRFEERAHRKRLNLHQGEFLHPWRWYLIVNQRKNEKLRKLLKETDIKQLDNDGLELEEAFKLGVRFWRLFVDGGLSEMVKGVELAGELITDVLT